MTMEDTITISTGVNCRIRGKGPYLFENWKKGAEKNKVQSDESFEGDVLDLEFGPPLNFTTRQFPKTSETDTRVEYRRTFPHHIQRASFGIQQCLRYDT